LPRDIVLSLGEAPDGSLLAGCRTGLFRLVNKQFVRLQVPQAGTIDAYNSIHYGGGDRTFLATSRLM